jgi:hypothetical protein
MGRKCSARGGDKYKILVGRPHSEDIGVDGRIILKRSVEK